LVLTNKTEIDVFARGDIDGDGGLGDRDSGGYNDGVRVNAQLCVWNGATLALENVKTWY